jgi:hypothetical protein
LGYCQFQDKQRYFWHYFGYFTLFPYTAFNIASCCGNLIDNVYCFLNSSYNLKILCAGRKPFIHSAYYMPGNTVDRYKKAGLEALSCGRTRMWIQPSGVFSGQGCYFTFSGLVSVDVHNQAKAVP